MNKDNDSEKRVVVETLEDAVSTVLESSFVEVDGDEEKAKRYWDDMDYPKVHDIIRRYKAEFDSAVSENSPRAVYRAVSGLFLALKNLGFSDERAGFGTANALMKPSKVENATPTV